MPLDMIAEFDSFAVRPLKLSNDIDAADPALMVPVIAYVEGHVDVMAKRAESLRAQIVKIADSQKETIIFGTVIDDLERRAEVRGRELAKMQKSMLFRLSEESDRPARRADVAKAASRIENALEREIALMSEMALFLRACRSNIDPNAHGGPTFDEPEEMEAYLRDRLAE